MLLCSACTRCGNGNAKAVVIQQVCCSILWSSPSTGHAVGVLHGSALGTECCQSRSCTGRGGCMSYIDQAPAAVLHGSALTDRCSWQHVNVSWL